jgi:ABC-type proline/glycine betaine transport system permease subunit
VTHVHDDVPEPLAGEYGAVTLPHAWHVLSLVFFAAAMGARFLTALIPRELLAGVIWRPVLTAFSVPLLATIGLLFALLGLRYSEGKAAAKIALFLNATVLLLSGVALWAFFRIMPG